MVLLVYVDDILIAGSNDDFIMDLIGHLSQEFAIKDLRSLHYFLGIEIKQVSGGILLSQSKYIKDLLTKTRMLDSSPITTPMVFKDKSTSSDDDHVDISAYQSIVGVLQYLTFTRPDIVYAVNRACQHFNNPTFANMKAVKRILRYLKGTQQFGLRYLSQSPISLYGFSDADWAGCPTTRRSTTGFCVFLGANCIS